MPGPIRFFGLCLLGLCLLLGQAYAGSSKGCGKDLSSKLQKGATGQSNKINYNTSQGVKRSFLLHLPKDYDKNKAHGLILSFHGRSGSAADQESLCKLSEPEKNKNMLVVYPEGINKQWQGDPAAKSDDVTFTLDMIKSFSEQFCIDPDKIYATGQSNGGGFAANILACHPVASRKIAAFAGVSGAYYQGSSDANCKPLKVPIPCNAGRKNVPILEFHGIKDDTIPYNGGKRRDRCLPNIPHFMTAWAERNGLGENYAQSNLYNNHVKKMEWGSGSLRGINTHYSIDNMGHTWPNEKSYYMNATPMIMDFFNKWTLASTPGARASNSPASSSGASNPSQPPLCPSQNNRNYAAPGGKTFRVLCGTDTRKHPAYTAATHPGSLRACITQCATDNKCGHVVFIDDKCWKNQGKPGSIDKAENARVAQKL
jgi:poly(3-hydroxybutyrate) depolymerase